MLFIGLDVGSENTKVIVMDETKKVLAKASVVTGLDQRAAAEAAISQSLQEAGRSRQDVTKITATGMGRNAIPEITAEMMDEVNSAAKGARFFFPEATSVIDAGAESGRALRLNNRVIVDFAVNEKCAAGAGAFVESMARALGVGVEDMGSMSLRSSAKVSMNAQCVIFAESEVVSLIHEETPKEDIVKAIHDAIADRLGALAKRVRTGNQAVLIGGMGNNVGFVSSLKSALGTDILVPPEPEFASALGAALPDEEE